MAIAAADRLMDYRVVNDPEQGSDDNENGKGKNDKKFRKKEKANEVVTETFELRVVQDRPKQVSALREFHACAKLCTTGLTIVKGLIVGCSHPRFVRGVYGEGDTWIEKKSKTAKAVSSSCSSSNEAHSPHVVGFNYIRRMWEERRWTEAQQKKKTHSAIMYGGDEVSAIVVDLGSHTCKAGYAGEDAPKAVFPSVVGSIDQMEVDDGDNSDKNSGSAPESKSKGKHKLYVGSQDLGFRRDHMEVVSPSKDGIVVDWDMVENIWDHALRKCLLVDPKEHPMLLAEPCSNTQQQREKTAEIMFEKYQVPALFLAKNAVLTSFASGRATSLVVDCGGGSTTVAPVHDGYVLQKAVATSPIGGEFLTDCLLRSLEHKGISIKPRYAFKRKEIRPGEFQIVDLDFPNTTESYKLYCQRVIVGDIKECVCRAPDTPYDETSYSNIPMTPYELPDGQFKIPDVLFNPSLVQTIPGMESFVETASSARGLPQMVIESINKCDVDIRRELFSSILLAGGTASMQQLKERLEKDLLEESPQAARVKVLASGNATERRFSVWIGGSILASLGSFQQMWFSKSEYEEHGASYIQRKCP
ncbi:Actin-related protein 4 [Sesamum alatum]|uniref:Actin-related protein 4 n=1 Tax=Sesamum alatum TaxID=300844 RepID=A0AAE1YAV5_9LAMI|nr:Actin-related protein 4 [Sesamum alatum]